MQATLTKVMLPVTTYLPADGSIDHDPADRTFNPSFLRSGDGYVAVYRWVSGGGVRSIMACRLERDLQPVAGSAVHLGDKLVTRMEFAQAVSRKWLADPRLFLLDGRYFVLWNDGLHHHEKKVLPLNNQFIAEIDPFSLDVISPVRRMVRIEGQFRPEKNWVLFSDAGQWRVVYSSQPHVILELVEITPHEMRWRERYITANKTEYSKRYGEMRGGCQPVLHGGRYFHFGHSAYRLGDTNHYVALVYVFEPTPPYRVIAVCEQPLELPRVGPDRLPDLATLNIMAGEVIFITGAVAGNRWHLAYGQDDKIGVFASISFDAVDALLTGTNAATLVDNLKTRAKALMRRTKHRLKVLLGRDAWTLYGGEKA